MDRTVKRTEAGFRRLDGARHFFGSGDIGGNHTNFPARCFHRLNARTKALLPLGAICHRGNNQPRI
jgi:hypothetical protein